MVIKFTCMKNNKWEEFYENTPLKQIPWQNNQSDYLTKVINANKIKPGRVLDLGCGTGMESIFLTTKGFTVTGIDISKTAINYAIQNSKKENFKIEFVIADATNLDFLKNRKFDLILDWANLHGIIKNKRDKYIEEILKHTQKGSKLILRCFGRLENEDNTVSRSIGNIFLFTKRDIKKIYGKHFKILEVNISKVLNKNAPSKFFYEFLMEKY